jgi:hypothetical protein
MFGRFIPPRGNLKFPSVVYRKTAKAVKQIRTFLSHVIKRTINQLDTNAPHAADSDLVEISTVKLIGIGTFDRSV